MDCRDGSYSVIPHALLVTLVAQRPFRICSATRWIIITISMISISDIAMISVAVAADEARAAPHAVSSVALIARVLAKIIFNNMRTCEKNILLCDDPCICLSLSPCNSNDDARIGVVIYRY